MQPGLYATTSPPHHASPTTGSVPSTTAHRHRRFTTSRRDIVSFALRCTGQEGS
jgi:hypothetical protein